MKNFDGAACAVQGRFADVAHAAPGAALSGPDGVEQRLDLIEQQVVFGHQPQLEVPPPHPFGAQARPRPVGAAEVQMRAVDDDRLEVDAWTGAQLQPPTIKGGVAIELFPESPRGRRRVQAAQIDPPARQLVEHLQH